MRITKLSIQNYKSLRNIEISPGDFSVLIGRNSSGKSNFADALEFLSIAYADGLEHAVAKKGGYENIAHRKERRSRSAISFAVELKADIKESEMLPAHEYGGRSRNDPVHSVTFRHSFEFRTSGEGIRSDFKITSENLDIIQESLSSRDILGETQYQWINLVRGSDGNVVFTGDATSALARAVLFDSRFWSGDVAKEFAIAPTELLFAFPFFRPRAVGRFLSFIRNLAIFQLSPDVSRHSGVPTPNPQLSARGENLPAVVDWLQRKRQKDWKLVLQAMRDIVPEIVDITVDYLHTRTLGLYFHEKGVGRPWTVDEVSDGTIRSLALLVACFDPRNSALVVEEPENSLHPWIIKEIVGNLRALSQQKLVMVTSHSPVVLNMLSPSEVWVIYKVAGETQLRPLTDFDPDLQSDWEDGKYRLFDYLESGIVSEAVPVELQ